MRWILSCHFRSLSYQHRRVASLLLLRAKRNVFDSVSTFHVPRLTNYQWVICFIAVFQTFLFGLFLTYTFGFAALLIEAWCLVVEVRIERST